MTLFSAQNLTYLALILSIISAIIIGYLFWTLRSLNKLRKTFFSGRSAGDLEHILYSLSDQITALNNKQLLQEHGLINLQNEFTFAVQKIGVIRYNPFNDGGGNFSFSMALLNAHDNGVVITSMHGREQNRIYTKKIESGKSDTTLTQEELQAILLANQNKNLRAENH